MVFFLILGIVFAAFKTRKLLRKRRIRRGIYQDFEDDSYDDPLLKDWYNHGMYTTDLNTTSDRNNGKESQMQKSKNAQSRNQRHEKTLKNDEDVPNFAPTDNNVDNDVIAKKCVKSCKKCGGSQYYQDSKNGSLEF